MVVQAYIEGVKTAGGHLIHADIGDDDLHISRRRVQKGIDIIVNGFVGAVFYGQPGREGEMRDDGASHSVQVVMAE